MFRNALTHLAAPLTCAAFLAACAGGEERKPAPVKFQGSQPSGTQSASPAAPTTPSGPDARGVVFNDGYETIIARDGDTVTSLADRVGITGAELAAYNGLPTTYRPKAGDELVLPAKPGGYRSATVVAAAPAVAPASAPPTTSTVPAPAAIETAPIGASSPATAPAADGSTWSASSIAAAIGTSGTTAPATTTPNAAPAPAEPALAPAPATATAPAAATATVTESAPTPIPQAQAVQPAPQPVLEPAQQAAAPASGALEETVVAQNAPAPAAATGTRFVRPVDAPVSRKFSRLPGPNRNDGVDFASPAGMDVRAAETGTVALVSNSLGGLGTIVLIRHEGGLLTVYGRVDGVTIRKGDTVTRGQVFAKVADLPSPREPSLHFEVRRGAESVDPAGFI
ncbi:MAG: peptidoglycan DD-metalloendopeptidase family protein [Pikeienuella sp.]